MPVDPKFYRRASMDTLAGRASALGIVHDTSLGSIEVIVPGLVFGTPFVERWPLREEPSGATWWEAAYNSYSPWVFTLPDAVIHSAAGIVCTGDFVVEETLAHTDPVAHAYVPDGDGIWIDLAQAPHLAGTHISALAGSSDSYHHTLLDGFGRLSVVPAAMLAGSAGLLTADERPATVAWLQDRVGERWSLRQHPVPAQGSLRVDQLVLASPQDSSCNYHPCLDIWFDALASLADMGGSPGPRRFFIDRRHAAARPLANEAAAIDALEALGIVPIALEQLSARAQIALFRRAELIVAPHGAGLANLIFAGPRCRVIELQMDAYCHWGFRRLAALKGLAYDCVVGRTIGGWPDRPCAVHAATWQISVQHVVAAVQAALAGA